MTGKEGRSRRMRDRPVCEAGTPRRRDLRHPAITIKTGRSIRGNEDHFLQFEASMSLVTSAATKFSASFGLLWPALSNVSRMRQS